MSKAQLKSIVGITLIIISFIVIFGILHALISKTNLYDYKKKCDIALSLSAQGKPVGFDACETFFWDFKKNYVLIKILGNQKFEHKIYYKSFRKAIDHESISNERLLNVFVYDEIKYIYDHFWKNLTTETKINANYYCKLDSIISFKDAFDELPSYVDIDFIMKDLPDRYDDSLEISHHLRSVDSIDKYRYYSIIIQYTKSKNTYVPESILFIPTTDFTQYCDYVLS